MTHTSGFQNEPDAVYKRQISPDELVHQYVVNAKRTRPIDSFNYNNLDYILLGLVIERFRGQPFQAVVRERILEPLKMTNSGFLKRDELPTDLAKGYLCKADKCREEPDYYIENFYAAGAMYATAEDLLKWDQALYGTDLLSETSRKIMYESRPELGYVAYGSWTYHYPFVAQRPFTIERRGGILGFNSVIFRFPDAHKTLIMMSNTDRFNPDSFGNPAHFKEQLIHALFDEPREK